MIAIVVSVAFPLFKNGSQHIQSFLCKCFWKFRRELYSFEVVKIFDNLSLFTLVKFKHIPFREFAWGILFK